MKLKVPDHDTFGYCVKCGKHMAEYKVVDGVYKMRLKGEYTTVVYKLNDNSNMRVAMCRTCADNLTHDEDEYNLIMTKVFRGWQSEAETFSHWDEDRKKDYLDRYSKKRIVVRADNIPSDSVDRVFKMYKKNEPKEVKHILKEKASGNRK